MVDSRQTFCDQSRDALYMLGKSQVKARYRCGCGKLINDIGIVHNGYFWRQHTPGSITCGHSIKNNMLRVLFHFFEVAQQLLHFLEGVIKQHVTSVVLHFLGAASATVTFP